MKPELIKTIQEYLIEESKAVAKGETSLNLSPKQADDAKHNEVEI